MTLDNSTLQPEPKPPSVYKECCPICKGTGTVSVGRYDPAGFEVPDRCAYCVDGYVLVERESV